MATTAAGTPYVEASDLVAGYPAVSLALANHIDGLGSASETATVATSQQTTSTVFADLATAGPAVTVTTGTKALVSVTAASYHNATGTTYSGLAVSGASTVAAGNENSVSGGGTTNTRASATFLVTGLTAGSNTFTMKYKVDSGTGNFLNRTISVIDMGS